MIKMDEATALSIIFSNTKTKKREKDLVTIAHAFDYLVKSDKYGSQTALAKQIDLSTEMIREFLNTLKLPLPVQRLVAARKIDSVDAVKELAAIRDHDKQMAVAYALINTPTKDARDIKRLVKLEHFSANDAKKVIQNAKPKGLHIFIIDFEEDTFRALQEHAKLKNLRTPDLVKIIVKKWLKKTNCSSSKSRR